MTYRAPLLVEPLESRIAPATLTVPVISLLDPAPAAGANFALPPGSYIGGTSVQAIGDLNGDGFADFAFSATISSGNSATIYVLFGGASGVPRGVDLTKLDGHNGFTYTDGGGDTGIPHTLASGDFNHDGIKDLAIGTPFYVQTGDVHVIFGKNTATAGAFAANLTPADVTGSVGFRVHDSRLPVSVQFGSGLAAGDLNGDGFDELIIGSPYQDLPIFGANNNFGATYVVMGRASFPADVDAGGSDASSVFRISGAAAGDNSGASVSVGDLNGDGFKDLLVGGYGAGTNYTNKGSAYVLFGKNSAFPLDYSAANLDGTNGFRIPGKTSFAARGTTVSLTGDLNGDGLADLVLGAPTQQVVAPYPFSSTEDGTVTVVFGKANGWSAVVDPATVNGTDGFIVKGGKFARLGRSLATGDFNGDGVDDLAMGSTENGSGGKVVILYGHSTGFEASYDVDNLGTGKGVIYNGLPGGSRTGESVSLSDLNGDGKADLVVGSPGYGAMYPSSYGPGMASVVYGSVNPGGPVPPPPIYTPHKVTFTDVDGDKVTVSITKGSFTAENFTFKGAGLGSELVKLSLGAGFEGSDLKITAAKTSFGGNAKVDVGAIDAAGVNLGAVSVSGDLGQIQAGPLSLPVGFSVAKAGVKSLTVGSFGKSLPDNASTAFESLIHGNLGKLSVADGFSEGALSVVGIAGATGTGKLGTVGIKGGVHGTAADGSGSLRAEGGIGAVTIAGGITTGTGDLSGSIRSGGAMGKLTITGDVLGSAGVPVFISALGQIGLAPAAKADLAIASITVNGKVDHALFLAGVDLTGVAKNGDASIGAILVKQSWAFSSVAAGIRLEGNGYGAVTDVHISEPSPLASRVAKIASIVIQGGLSGTAGADETYGFVAEEIGSARIKDAVVSLTRGANNNLPVQLLNADGHISLHEVAG